MEQDRRVRIILWTNAILVVLVIIGLIVGIPSFVCLVALLIFQPISIFAIRQILIKPYADFNKRIDMYIASDGSNEDFLNKRIDDSVMIKKLQTVIERYSNNKIRENLAEVFDKQAELTALQSQINPHFLYNTLESIRGQALIDDNDEIAKMVEALSSFFRYSISRRGDLVTLRDELTNIKNYMTIQQYRFNNRFVLKIYIDEEDEKAYDFFMPKLILQPIIENAIFHGLEECIDQGVISIELIVTEYNMILTVSDNGTGMDRTTLKILNDKIHSANQFVQTSTEKKGKHSGIALMNIQRRIRLLFGEDYGLTVYSTLGQGTDVEVILPINQERKPKIYEE